MQGAFVLRLGVESDVEKQQFAGWIEEVDTGREIRFRSTEELLRFLGQCLDDRRRHHQPGKSRDERGM
jgi:hypothetical protein